MNIERTQKIIDVLKAKEDANQSYFSFEYFPARTEAGVFNLLERLDHMGTKLKPDFVDLTWRARTQQLSLDVAIGAQTICGLETQLHLCVAGLTRRELLCILAKIKKSGIRNILALRGDPPEGHDRFSKTPGGFSYAYELVELIREQYGDYFSISVAGYPEGLGECPYEEELKHLKQKVDAGADFIISQLFFDTDRYIKWVKDCREIGITCPIIPGILPIQSWRSFSRMCELNPTVSVPPSLRDAIAPLKNDDQAVREYGVEFAVQQCRTLLDTGAAKGIHFYTINLEVATAKIVTALGWAPEKSKKHKMLPYRSCLNSTRKDENVRPIFWAHRPKSYIHRTKKWGEFPNGRWGDSESPAFGELNDYHLFFLHVGKKFDRRAMWGEHPTTLADVADVFLKFLAGKIERLPWHDTRLEPESTSIYNELVFLNQNGFLTINSQPAVNGVSSRDSTHGWGPGPGFVFKKAYVEFFCSPRLMQALVKRLPEYDSLTYHAENLRGECHKNCDVATAVTWGVFHGAQILQPTVVDPKSFSVWKDEAFGLWETQWATIYPEDSKSRALILGIYDSFWLVNIVENDFIHGDLFKVFRAVVQDLQESGELESAIGLPSSPATSSSEITTTTTTTSNHL
mmetsp:Transcript_10833/g.33218  ORF Transcript_10833/g.33218 Transcript_10833/m.33218 type:complete len:629 (-) Transcript_10833:25-1911(-)